MCGRYTLKHAETVARLIASITGEDVRTVAARYNVSPSQSNPVVRPDPAGKPTGVLMRWGLVPFWDKSEKPTFAPINARSEDMFGKPTFRQSVQKRRCVIPADGFYEWKRLDERTKIPHHICMKGDAPFFIAGLYEEATESRPETYCLLTTGPNALMEAIHDRMPVILPAPAVTRWLQPGPLSPEDAQILCRPYSAEEMTAWAVSSLVNKPANDVPDCVVPVLATTSAPEEFKLE